MADSRQTKIVSYQLQGDATNLINELNDALTVLDQLDKRLTYLSTQKRVIAGKDKTSFKRAAYITGSETRIESIRKRLDPDKLSTVSPDQLNLLKQANMEMEKQLVKLEKFKSAETTTDKALEKLKVSLGEVDNALRKSGMQVEETADAWEDFKKTLSKIGAIVSVVKMVINWIDQLYESTADFVEVNNLFNVATKSSTKNLRELAESMEEAYHADISDILQSIAVFRQYANTMGFTADAADTLSEYLTEITYDLASLYNVSSKDMLAAVKSGLAGQTKSLMQYGISVHKATLEQYALNLGLNKTWTSFSETEKVALRYITILDQATLAQGDLAKTLESPSNQLKILKAQLEVFMRTLGQLVTTLGTTFLPVINATMIAVNKFLEAMSTAAGFEVPDYSDKLSENNQMLSDGTDAAEDYADALRNTLAPLDEINQQSSGNANNGLGTIDPKILAALEGYDNLMSRISTRTDALADAFSKILNPELFRGVGTVMGSAFDLLESGITAVTNVLQVASPALGAILTVVGKIVQVASTVVDTILEPVTTLIVTLTSNVWLLVGAFAALNLAQLAITGNWKAMTAVKIITWFASLTKTIAANTTTLLANVAATIKAKAAAIASAAAQWLEAAAWWQKAIAVIAAAGSLALVVSGIVIAATASAKSQSNSVMNSSSVPAMAEGGVVTSPTVALIGEGRYKEAIVPLGNSPQFKTMKDDIASEVLRKIAPTPRASYGSTSRGSTPVILQLNGKELARAILPDLGYAQPQTGVRLKI